MTHRPKPSKSVRDGGISIFLQTFLVTLGVAFVPVAGLVFSNHQASTFHRELLEADMKQTSREVGLVVDAWLGMNRKALQQNAQLPALASMETEQQVPVLSAIAQTYDWSYLAFTVGMDGYMAARSDRKPLVDENGDKAYFRGDRQYVKQVIDSGVPLGHQLLISRTTGEPALCLSAPINRQDATALLTGVAVSCSELTAISREVADTRIGETGIALLVDENNQLIAHGNEDVKEDGKLRDFKTYPALQKGISEQLLEFEWNDRDLIAYVQPIGLEGWKLVIQRDAAEAYQPVVAARNTAAAMTVGAIGLTLAIAYAFSRTLTRPLKSLTIAAESVSRGKLDVRIEGSQRGDEIGALARAVKRLSASVAIAYEELSRDAQKRDAQSQNTQSGNAQDQAETQDYSANSL